MTSTKHSTHAFHKCGLCVGMLNPHRLDDLYKVFHKAKALGLYIASALHHLLATSFAAELMGLRASKNELENKGFTRGLQWWPTARDSG
eukprot:1148661-Pelagomonas_calceolata.AAC.1